MKHSKVVWKETLFELSLQVSNLPRRSVCNAYFSCYPFICAEDFPVCKVLICIVLNQSRRSIIRTPICSPWLNQWLDRGVICASQSKTFIAIIKTLEKTNSEYNEYFAIPPEGSYYRASNAIGLTCLKIRMDLAPHQNKLLLISIQPKARKSK